MEIDEKNVGIMDRVIRIVLGIVLIVVFLMKFVPELWSDLVVIIGLIALVTGIIGACPLYSIFRISTISTTESKIH